ncbi:hypothetical protein [Bifidobacterium aquikefiri]|uniref:DNA-binding protein n=3 Tax=Bifidobacterium aquikefiri TaxID=1653207 RepID=A0A261G3S7_9BIFI|nr:hypothetical protein [Bifidobacterium aquikefiri]OZG65843.1 DNA-binding protein [Bifidobacterium aquikefiri]
MIDHASSGNVSLSSQNSLGKSRVKMSNDEDRVGPWKLFPLTPKFDASVHAPYVKELEACLKRPDIHNVALTGSYGVGKSSILGELARKHAHEVVQISLSTLAPIDLGKVDKSVPKQATTTTNRIQQEIVKQLLYSEQPKDMPQSRFNRIGRPNLRREMIAALYGGLVCVATFLATNWYMDVLAAFSLSFGIIQHLLTLLLVFVLFSALSFGAVYMLHGRVHVRQFSAGPATVTLDEQSVSFFDQYLDEIMYYFERSNKTLVIFEDLDRFNDSDIFETLRSLNILLNSTKERKDKPIQFIYALKDSVFDNESLKNEQQKTREQLTEDIPDIEDPAEAESIRANRTKFFDIVIPVVPFISHTTAGSLIRQLLSISEFHISPSIMDLAGRYVTDMRLLKNTCNEFIIFHNRLNAGEGVDVEFNDDQIFAMMLYKNTSMRQFELMRIGKSNMDRLYADYRNLVSRNISGLQEKNRDLESKKTQINQISDRSNTLGEKFDAALQLVAKVHGYTNGTPSFNINFNNQTITTEDMKNEAFWDSYIKVADKQKIKVSVRNGYYGNSLNLTFDKTDIAAISDISLDESSWEPNRLKDLSSQIDMHREQISFLRSADMADLIPCSEFTLAIKLPKTEENSIDNNEGKTSDNHSFNEIAQYRLGNGLAYELVKKGVLNRNYALYAQMFYGDRVSAAATNFIHHQIEPNQMDVEFSLNDRDVADVLRMNENHDLGERAFYNISILSYILDKYYVENQSQQPDVRLRTDKLIDALSHLGEDERKFLQAYYESGQNEATKAVLIPPLLQKNTNVLEFFISEIKLNESDRLRWTNLTLENLDAKSELKEPRRYNISDKSCSFLRENLTELLVLKQEDIHTKIAVAISTVLQKADAVATDLNVFANKFAQQFVVRNMYEINRANMMIITGSAGVSLDCLLSVQPKSVYKNVLSHLPEYLSVLDSGDHTIEKPAVMSEVLNEVAAQETFDISLAARLISRSADDCKITVLAAIKNDDICDELVKRSKIVLTYTNVILYISMSDGINQNLAKMLNAEKVIVDIPKDEESVADRKELAMDIINSKPDLLDVPLKIQLIEGMELETLLDVNEEMSVQDGDLPAELIKHKIIADDENTFIRLKSASWETREKAIAISEQFKTFMNQELIPPTDLDSFLQSKLLSSDLKCEILNNFTLYSANADKEGLEAIAKFAIQQKRKLSFEEFHILANAQISSSLVIKLICLNLNTEDALSLEQIQTILSQLPGDYNRLLSSENDQAKIPKTTENRKLLQYLKNNGSTVASFDEMDTAFVVSKQQ